MIFYRAFGMPSKFARQFLFFTNALGHNKRKDLYIDREYSNNNLIMYVLSGKLHVEQNGHFVLSKDEGIIMRLTDKHKYYTDEVDTCEILWLHFNGKQTETFLKYIEESHTLPLIFKEKQVEILIRHCFTLFDSRNSKTEFLVSQTIYNIILAILYSIMEEKEKLNVNQKTEFINEAMNYVESNLYNNITLESFAGQFYISNYHFCRVFRKYFRMSPMKYVLMKKIEISKYMLTYTNDSVSSIANSLGFSDQSHFSKTFKSFEGKSPTDYRKK